MSECNTEYQVIGIRHDGSIGRQSQVRGLEFARMIAAMWRWYHRELAVRIESPDGISNPQGILFELKPR